MKSPLKPAIKLRGHHLICLHFFRGEGYNSKFIENLKEVLERAEAGEDIEISLGTDDICRRCPYLKRGRCNYDTDAEDEIREMDRKALQLLGLEACRTAKWVDIREKVPEILDGWSKEYCKECDWRTVCEKRAIRPRRSIERSVRLT